MELSEIINLVLGGSLVATIVTVITLKSTVRKAIAEAEKATAEAETVRIGNTEQATRILIENIVNPLREELNGTRKDLQATKREMARLRKAIDTANSCRYSDDCPVLLGMHEFAKNSDRPSADCDKDDIGQYCGRGPDCSDQDHSGRTGGDAVEYGQSLVSAEGSRVPKAIRSCNG